jgi:formylglycine-generating enzyme required for sulfatase activity
MREDKLIRRWWRGALLLPTFVHAAVASCVDTSADDMVRIPGGSFGDAGSGPQTEHVLGPFLLDVAEVTVSEYSACVDEGPCKTPATQTGNACNWGLGDRGDHPVNCVDWDDATTFCAWAGKRLPTEWEWEWAARGRDEARIYPWGQVDPTTQACWARTTTDLTLRTCPVGAHSPDGDSRDGVQGLAGNVSEWTDSWLDLEETIRVARGGSWDITEFDAFALRTDYRTGSFPYVRDSSRGFRCALDP